MHGFMFERKQAKNNNMEYCNEIRLNKWQIFYNEVQYRRNK